MDPVFILPGSGPGIWMRMLIQDNPCVRSFSYSPSYHLDLDPPALPRPRPQHIDYNRKVAPRGAVKEFHSRDSQGPEWLCVERSRKGGGGVSKLCGAFPRVALRVHDLAAM